MKKRRYILFILIALIIAALSALIYFDKKKSEFIYCDPAAPRGNDLAKWQEIITPKQEITPVDNDFFDKIEISSDANEICIQYPTSTGSPEDPFPFEIREMTLDQPLEIGEGILKFLGISVAYCDSNHLSGEDVPYKFFNAQFQPEKEEIINELWPYNKHEKDSRFQYNPWPFVRFCFEYQEIEDVKFLGINVFDVRTRKLLSSGYSSGGTLAEKWSSHDFKVNMPVWHQTPIDLVIDVSFGPSKTFEFPPEVGEGFKYEGFECRLISILDDIDTSRSSNSSYDKKSIIRIFKAAPNRKGSSFIFACHPTASKMPVTFSFLDKDGQNLTGRGSSTTGYIQENRLDQPLEKVTMIQAKYRTNIYRIIVHLPYIPGLPEQNKNIENLFDVYIPYVKFDSAGRIDDFINKTLQLQRSKTTGRKPSQNIQNSSFPIIFTDMTIRDIAKQYESEATINANIENDVLEIQYPIPFLTKLKMLFYRIRQNDNE